MDDGCLQSIEMKGFARRRAEVVTPYGCDDFGGIAWKK